MPQLTPATAFEAMRLFLEGYQRRTNSDDVASLLSDLRPLADGKPVDPAAWDDWIKCVERAERG